MTQSIDIELDCLGVTVDYTIDKGYTGTWGETPAEPPSFNVTAVWLCQSGTNARVDVIRRVDILPALDIQGIDIHDIVSYTLDLDDFADEPDADHAYELHREREAERND
tara:strand:+ start:853 stop:1179 length:327 start_codon:yes stop_codon:yes gene_type:complete